MIWEPESKLPNSDDKMEFIYKGDLIIYPKVGNTSQSSKTHKIEFKYYNLMK